MATEGFRMISDSIEFTVFVSFTSCVSVILRTFIPENSFAALPIFDCSSVHSSMSLPCPGSLLVGLARSGGLVGLLATCLRYTAIALNTVCFCCFVIMLSHCCKTQSIAVAAALTPRVVTTGAASALAQPKRALSAALISDPRIP